MDIILKEDIRGLGYKNDKVEVKSGYGRNYLIPRGLAIVASKSNIKMVEENIRQASHKAEKLKNDALAIAEKIGDLVLEIGTKAGESGKIFGAITNTQVAESLKDKGFNIDKRIISFKGQIKDLGDYEVEIDLHKEVKHTVKLNVVAD